MWKSQAVLEVTIQRLSSWKLLQRRIGFHFHWNWWVLSNLAQIRAFLLNLWNRIRYRSTPWFFIHKFSVRKFYMKTILCTSFDEYKNWELKKNPLNQTVIIQILSADLIHHRKIKELNTTCPLRWNTCSATFIFND